MLGPTLVVDAQITPSSTSSLSPADTKFHTRSGRTALRWLRNRSLGFSKIVVDPSTWDEDFATLVLEARKNRPVTPIYALGNEDGLSDLDLARLGMAGRISRQTLATGAGQSQPLSQAVSLLDEGEFLGVPVVDFLELEQVQFDLYLKSPQGKWVLLAQAGEPGLGARIQTYWSRGLGFLYIQKAAYQRQIDAIQMFRSLLPRSTTGSGVVRSARAIADTSKVLQSLKSMESITREVWDHVSDSILMLNHAWNQSPWSDPRTAIRNAALLDHSLSVLMISLIVGRSLGFESEDSTLKLGLAAAFHDMGLLDFAGALPANESKAAISNLNPQQREHFLSHPSRGAQWIHANFSNESLVAQAVALHHWRRDDSGFYERGAQPILEAPRLAEIVGISEEISHQLLKFPFGIQGARLEGVVQSVTNQFSASTLDGTREALMPAIRVRMN